MTTNLPTQCRLLGLPEPVAEHRFHPTRLWRWDFAWPEQRVAVEVQGGGHEGVGRTRGRHHRHRGYSADCEKLAEGQLLGWVVLWATPEQVSSGQALEWVRRALGKEAK